MGERRYLDDSSVKVARVGEKLDAKFRVVASLRRLRVGFGQIRRVS